MHSRTVDVYSFWGTSETHETVSHVPSNVTDTARTGDNPRIINDRGSKSCRSQQRGATTRWPSTR